MKPLVLGAEAENIGGTCIIKFLINGKLFCLVPARTRYVDVAEETAERIVAGIFTEQIQEVAAAMGLTDGGRYNYEDD